MKKYVLVLLASSSIWGCLKAQTVADIIPQIGYEYVIAIDFPLEDAGPAGEGVTWDFSDLQFGQVAAYSVIEPSAAIANESFPDASAAFEVELFADFYLYSFFDFSDENWVELGTSTLVDGNEGGTFYSDPHTWLTTPLAFGTTGGDSYAGVSETTFSTDSVYGSMEWSVDGTGTLIMPNATYTDVLRIRSEGSETITIEVSGFSFEITTLETNHIWVKDGVPFPLLQLSESQEDLGGEVEIEYNAGALVSYSTEPMGVDDSPSTTLLKIFPNPATDRFFVEMDGATAQRNQWWGIYDVQGRLVLEGRQVFAPGSAAELHVETLPAGLYVLRIKGESGWATSKLLIE